MKKLIKLDYFYAWHGFTLSLLVFSIIIFSLPKINVAFDLGIVLTISTFLFGILSAFFISERYSRYEKLRELVAKETGEISFIYTISKGINKKKAEELKKLIDSYLVESMNYEFYEYQIKIEPQFKNIENFITSEFNNLNQKQAGVYNTMLNNLGNLNEVRKEISLLGRDQIEKIQWVVLISLAVATIISTTLYLNVNLLTKILAILFSSIIILIILILRDLDNIRWRRESISIEPFEETFDFLDLPRFYLNIDIITNRANPPKDKDYRIGYHNPGEKPNIKLIKINKHHKER